MAGLFIESENIAVYVEYLCLPILIRTILLLKKVVPDLDHIIIEINMAIDDHIHATL